MSLGEDFLYFTLRNEIVLLVNDNLQLSKPSLGGCDCMNGVLFG